MNPLNKFLAAIRDSVYEIFGANEWQDLLQTVVLLKYLKLSLYLSVSLATVDQIIRAWTGLYLDVYVLFVLGIFMDTVMTFYIFLFVRSNEKFSKYAIVGKSILKIIVYSFLFITLHRFQLSFTDFTVLTFNINVFDWLYKLVVTFVFIQLVLGLLNKANDAGLEEMKGLMDFINRKFGKTLNNAGNKEQTPEKETRKNTTEE